MVVDIPHQLLPSTADAYQGGYKPSSLWSSLLPSHLVLFHTPKGFPILTDL
jgi:hypothetical protein